MLEPCHRLDGVSAYAAILVSIILAICVHEDIVMRYSLTGGGFLTSFALSVGGKISPWVWFCRVSQFLGK